VHRTKGRVVSYVERAVLVIGGLGFVGVNLTTALIEAGARVHVMTPLRERHAEQAARLEQQGAAVFEGDVRDAHAVAKQVARKDVIFNLSGQSGAVRSMEDPWTDLDVNLRGNLVLLEAMRESAPDAKLVLAGSRLQYGKPQRVPVAEDDAREPLCLHAIHKQTAEEYLRLYARLFGIRSAVARVTNPFGPGQPSGRTAYGIINRFIHLALDDQPLVLFGDGSQVRDYIYVSDLVDALMQLGISDVSDGRVYNVGSGEATRMADVARLIVDVAGSGRVEHAEWPQLAEKIETGDFVADISRVRDELGWRPKVALADGIARTVRFYRQRLAS
jgi:nucleoside-diphosphate-sugar epimerase